MWMIRACGSCITTQLSPAHPLFSLPLSPPVPPLSAQLKPKRVILVSLSAAAHCGNQIWTRPCEIPRDNVRWLFGSVQIKLR